MWKSAPRRRQGNPHIAVPRVKAALSEGKLPPLPPHVRGHYEDLEVALKAPKNTSPSLLRGEKMSFPQEVDSDALMNKIGGSH